MAGKGMRLSKFANPLRPTPFGDVVSSIDIVEHPAEDTRWMNGIELFVPAVNVPVRHSLDCAFTGTDVAVTAIAAYERTFEPFVMQVEVNCSTLSSFPALDELRMFTEAEFEVYSSAIAESHLLTGAFNDNGLTANNEGFAYVADDVSVTGGTLTGDLVEYAEYLSALYFTGSQTAIFIPANEFAHITHAAGMPFIDGKWFTPTGNQVIPFTTGVGQAGSVAEKVWVAELPIVLHMSQVNPMVPETWIQLEKNKFHVHVERVGLFEYRNVLSFDIAGY